VQGGFLSRDRDHLDCQVTEAIWRGLSHRSPPICGRSRPVPESLSLGDLPAAGDWRAFCRAHIAAAAQLLDDCRNAVLDAFESSVRKIVASALGTELSPAQCQLILGLEEARVIVRFCDCADEVILSLKGANSPTRGRKLSSTGTKARARGSRMRWLRSAAPAPPKAPACARS